MPIMKQSSPGIALLVDIENIKISVALESAIIKIFPPVEMIKIAVANWQLLKGIDLELLDRGYHLFHVPTGVNNADYELINLGWMLNDVSELIIVSSDRFFIRFASQLKFGLKATSVVYYSKTQSAFVITKTQVLPIEDELVSTIQSKAGSKSCDQTHPFTSQPQFAQALKQLVAKNKSINSSAALGTEFHKEFGVKASSVITQCQIPVSFAKFIIDNEILSDASSKDELITNIRQLIKSHPDLVKEPGRLGGEFKKIYGISISEQMKQIGITGKLSKFIAEIQPERNCDRN
jgi:hypothetical protein